MPTASTNCPQKSPKGTSSCTKPQFVWLFLTEHRNLDALKLVPTFTRKLKGSICLHLVALNCANNRKLDGASSAKSLGELLYIKGVLGHSGPQPLPKSLHTKSLTKLFIQQQGPLYQEFFTSQPFPHTTCKISAVPVKNSGDRTYPHGAGPLQTAILDCTHHRWLHISTNQRLLCCTRTCCVFTVYVGRQRFKS